MQKRRMGFAGLWNMSFGFFGIQIAFGLQNANVSRIFQTLGAEMENIALLWIAAPLTGLIVQPIVGHFSDKTWGPLGRRRPYFLVGALLTAASLLYMPLAPYLLAAAVMLWVLDASINVTMEPFRAFVGDLLPDEQRTTGFAMQSFFIGSGAVLASVLPWVLSNWFGVSNTAPEGVVPESVRWAFWIGAVAVLVAVLWTVFTTREYGPAEVEAMERARAAETGIELAEPPLPEARAFMLAGVAWLLAGTALALIVRQFSLEKELYLLAGAGAGFGALQLLAGAFRSAKARANGFTEIVDDLFRLPPTMRQLAVVQFFSWFALFAMWIYTTGAVTSFHYGAADATSKAYAEGADWVGVLFGVYNGVAALAAFLIPVIARGIGRKGAHALNLILGALGLLSFTVIRDPAWLWVGMVGVGFAWASILSVPYSILAGALPARKMGVYMGIFNIFIVVPQLLAATVLGLLLKTFFGGQAIWALVLGAGAWFVAAVCCFAVTDPAARRAIKA
jgi:maltose/moltooligosaccharide transporter